MRTPLARSRSATSRARGRRRRASTALPQVDWYDRRTGKPIRVLGSAPIDPETRTHALARGDVTISLLGDVLAQYRRRPEHKSLGPDGTPIGRDTRGLLQRRPVTSGTLKTELVGKEGNKLEERAERDEFVREVVEGCSRLLCGISDQETPAHRDLWNLDDPNGDRGFRRSRLNTSLHTRVLAALLVQKLRPGRLEPRRRRVDPDLLQGWDLAAGTTHGPRGREGISPTRSVGVSDRL